MRILYWQQIKDRPRWWTGKVASLSPLTVTPTGAATPVQMAGCHVAGLAVGDDVEVRTVGSASTLTGKFVEY